jgi:Ca2+-binding RTX toxin-like protein
MFGGEGNDTLNSGTGGDLMAGDAGLDIVSYAHLSSDLIITLDGVHNDGPAGENDNIDPTVDIVIGGSGNDSMLADTSLGVRVFYGNAGNDTLTGGPGADRLVGGPGNDLISGLGGNDTLISGRGSDTMFGGSGIDLASFYYETNPLVVSLDGVANDGIRKTERANVMPDIENLEGGQAKDTLIGSNGPNLILGGAGNDLILGLNHKDTLKGGVGSDTLNGGAHNDILRGGPGPDRFIGGHGFDTADYSDRTDNVFLSLDDLTNDGGFGEFDKIDDDVEILLGGSGDDQLTGSGRNETLDGGLGKNTVIGGGGTDVVRNG